MASLIAMSLTSPRSESSRNAVVSREAHEYMTSLTSTVPDKVEVLALVEAALSWDVDSAALPAVQDALNMARQFTDYGRVAANDLQTQILSLPADSDLCISAQATLGEASRRLHLTPPAQSAAPGPAAKRAQNLARLVQALNRTIDEVGREQVRTRPVQAPQRE